MKINRFPRITMDQTVSAVLPVLDRAIIEHPPSFKLRIVSSMEIPIRAV